MVPLPSIPVLMADSPVTQAEFARLLHAAWKASGLTQQEVARRSGGAVSAKHLSGRLLKEDYGAGPPARHIREALERALAVPTGYLSGGVNLEAPPADPVKPPRSAYTSDVISTLRDAAEASLRRNQRGAMVDFVSALFWVNEIHAVAKEVLDAPVDSPPVADEHHLKG